MKRIILSLMALCLCAPVLSRTERRIYQITCDIERKNCPVVIGDIPTWAASVRVIIDGREIPCQLDKPLGEAVFQTDITGSGKRCRVILSSKPAHREWPKRVHAQMWLKNPDKSLRLVDTAASTQNDMYHQLHHHGPAFESEFAAYRIYFDDKQTVDTYGKKHGQLELEATNWYPTDEQMADGYGYDNLRVSGSTGVGALKGWDAKKQKMTHIADYSHREARIIAKGPVRTVVEMAVEGWKYGDRTIDMTSRYILYAGHGEMEVENRIDGDFRNLIFTTGLMRIKENRVKRSDDFIAEWGRDFPETDTLKWERESVGLAISVAEEQVVSQIDDKSSYLVQMTPDARGHIDYTAGMIWRRSEWLDGRSDDECLDELTETLRTARHKAAIKRIK